MQTTWLNTNDYYHQIIAAPNQAAREHLYHDLFIQPWKQMMAMLAPRLQPDPTDETAVARNWGWLLPEDLTETPAVLRQLEAANSWQKGADALAYGAGRFANYADQIPIEAVKGWLIIADPARSNPINRGYTGAIDWTQPQIIIQVDTPNEYTLPRLTGAIVHELHHLIRLQCFPWDMVHTSVADYIIHEGLAESFAAACFGEAIIGYYVTDFNETELATAQALIRDGLNKTGFDVIRAYIFGDTLAESFGFNKIGMPDYGGYAIGYRVVQAYLQRTGQTIEEATFCSAETIIHESGFFD